MEKTAKARKQRYATADRKHTHWKTVFEEAYDYVLPQRESFYDENTPGRRRGAEVFDETAVVGVQEFASRLQAGMIPSYSRWANLRAGSEVAAEQRSEVDQSLSEITEYVFEVIQSSNFAQEANESLLDLAIGTGVMVAEEGNAVDPINFRTIALPSIRLLCGPDDKLSRFYWVRKLTVEDILIEYPKAKLPPDVKLRQPTANGMSDKLTVIEAVEKDYDAKDSETYDYWVMLETSGEVIHEEQFKGEGSNPYIAFRWSKAAGETYGRGPVLNALAAIKTTNLTVQLILENAEMSIAGIWQAASDAEINPETTRLVPGTINIHAEGSDGLRPMNPGGDFNVADLILSDMRMNIKRALYNDMLGDPNKTPASATEIAARQAELSNRVGAAFGRLQTELVEPIIKRVIYILKKQNKIKLPRVNGKEVKIQAISPLAQSQHQQDIVVLDQFFEMLAKRFGPQVAMMIVKQDLAIPYLAERFNVPGFLLRTPDELLEVANQLREQAAQNPEMAQAAMENAGPGPTQN